MEQEIRSGDFFDDLTGEVYCAYEERKITINIETLLKTTLHLLL
jgi:hypothetical protein